MLIGLLFIGITACEKEESQIETIANKTPDNTQNHFPEKADGYIVPGIAIWVQAYGNLFFTGCKWDPNSPCLIVVTASSSATTSNGVYVGSAGGDSTIGYIGYQIEREWESGDTTFFEFEEVAGVSQDTIIYDKTLDEFIDNL